MSKWCYFTDHRYSQLNIFPFLQVINNISILSDQASIREPWILYRFLQLAKDPNVVREQDFFTLLTFVSANRWPTYSETQKRFKRHIDPGSSLKLYSKMSYLGFPDRFNFNFLLKLQVPFTITSYFYNYKLLLQLQVPFTITSSFYNYKYFFWAGLESRSCGTSSGQNGIILLIASPWTTASSASPSQRLLQGSSSAMWPDLAIFCHFWGLFQKQSSHLVHLTARCRPNLNMIDIGS